MQMPATRVGEDVPATEGGQATGGRSRTIVKNVFAALALFGFLLALETGYFSNDRTSRTEWNEMERLKATGKSRVVYEARFDSDLLSGRKEAAGWWGFYNGATADTASIVSGALELRYTSAWIGTEFRHTKYEANTAYRVVIEANVEEQPAAILMRNRKLDLLREQIPVTNGQFKEFSYFYVAPGGRFDRVRVVFMPDNRSDVKGRMTVRKFRIEKLGG